MTGLRKLAVLVAAALAVSLLVVPSAGAQTTLTLAVSCEDTTLTVNWTDAPQGSAQIEVWYGDPPYSSADRDQRTTLNIVTGNVTGVRRFTVPVGTSGFTRMSVLAGSELTQADASFDCPISDAAEYLLLGNILAELETIDSRLTNVNRNVQMTTTNVADVEVLLATSNETLARIESALTDKNTGLPALLGGLDARLAAVAASADASAAMDSRIAARVAHLEATANQARHQTQALLALVALVFAIWLRRIFRSRKDAT